MAIPTVGHTILPVLKLEVGNSVLPNLDHVEQKARGSVVTFDDTNNLVDIVGHL